MVFSIAFFIAMLFNKRKGNDGCVEEQEGDGIMMEEKKRGRDFAREMTRGRRIFLFCFAASAAALVIYGALFFYLYLDRPVFVRHYLDLEFPEAAAAEDSAEGELDGDVGGIESEADDGVPNYIHPLEFRMYYLTERFDRRIVSTVIFEEAPELSFRADENTGGPWFFMDNGETEIGIPCGRYSVRSVNMSLLETMDFRELGDVTLSRARVLFSDGTEMNADMGKLILRQPEENSAEQLHSDRAEASSDGTGSESFVASENLRFAGLEERMLAEMNGLWSIRINGDEYTEAVGKEYEMGKLIKVSFAVQVPEAERRFDIYDARPCLLFENEHGRQRRMELNNLNYYGPYAGDGVSAVKYVKAREAE